MAGNGLSRRSFLIGAAATGISAAFLSGDVSHEGYARLPPDVLKIRYSNNPVNQGAASTWSGSRDLVVTSRICPPSYVSVLPIEGSISVVDKATNEQVAVQKVFAKNADDYRVRAVFNGLDPNKHYRYEVRADELGGRTFSGNTNSPLIRPASESIYGRDRYVRLVFASCMEYTRGFWNSFSYMSERNPDAVFIIGDSIYADVETRMFSGQRPRKDPIPYADDYELFLMKYLACNDSDRIRFLANSPGYFVPDDHEMRNNVIGTDRSERQVVDDGCRAYAKVYASANGADINGFYRRVDFGQGTRVIVLDTRRFRDVDRGTMLGDKQLDWFKKELAAAKSDNVTRLMVVTSVSFVSGLERITDSWAGFDRERQHVIDEIAKLDLKNVTFVSGDLHTFYAGAVHLDPLNTKTDTVAYEFLGGAVSSKVGETGNTNGRVLANSKHSNGIMEMDIYDDGSMITTWWLYDAKKRDYVPTQGARFLNNPQSKYGPPPMSLQRADLGLIENPGQIPVLA